jgi:hypothetical protein
VKRQGTACNRADKGSTDKCCCYPIGVIAYIVALFGIKKLSDEKKKALPDVAQSILRKVRNVQIATTATNATTSTNLRTLRTLQFSLGETTYKYLIGGASSFQIYAVPTEGTSLEGLAPDAFTLSDIRDIVHVTPLFEKVSPDRVAIVTKYDPNQIDAFRALISDNTSSILQTVHVLFDTNSGIDIIDLVKRIPKRQELIHITFMDIEHTFIECVPPVTILDAVYMKFAPIFIRIKEYGYLTVEPLHALMESMKYGRFIRNILQPSDNSDYNVWISMSMLQTDWNNPQCWLPFVGFYPNENSAFIYWYQIEKSIESTRTTRQVNVYHIIDEKWFATQSITMESRWDTSTDIEDAMCDVTYDREVHPFTFPQIKTKQKVLVAVDLSNERLAQKIKEVTKNQSALYISTVDVLPATLGYEGGGTTENPSPVDQGECVIS